MSAKIYYLIEFKIAKYERCIADGERELRRLVDKVASELGITAQEVLEMVDEQAVRHEQS